MHQPPGFKDPQLPNHVCLLKKSIYGLKQAPRQWFTTFSSYLVNLGFKFSLSDPSLLTYHHNSHHLYLLIYVDDILITGNSPTLISSIISNLQTRFQIKILGPINQFLGIHTIHTPTGLLLSQQQYAESILTRAGLSSCKPVQNPFPPKPPTLSSPQTTSHDPSLYRHLVGALQYLTITRPDIQFVTNTLCQHLHNPTALHFALLKRLLRYIRGTTDLSLPIKAGNLQLRSYSDANWANDPSDRRSTTGFCSYLGETLVSWQVRKQPTIAKSSTEAEYRSLATAATDIIWLRRLLTDFQISTVQPTKLFCDNISAIALASNPVFHARTKHIEIDYHFIRERVQSKEIEVLHVNSADQPADIFTKPLSTPRFKLLRHKLTLQSPQVNLRGDVSGLVSRPPHESSGTSENNISTALYSLSTSA